MRTPVSARQAHALGVLLSTMPARFDFDTLGDPRVGGPILVDFDRLTVKVTEDGVCCLIDADQIAAVA